MSLICFRETVSLIFTIDPASTFVHFANFFSIRISQKKTLLI